jgi:hypothetical protein
MATATTEDLFVLEVCNENIRALSHVLQLILRVGKELYIEIDGDDVTFHSMNDSKSAYVSVEMKDIFFSRKDLKTEEFSCKIPIKPVHTIFRNLKSMRKLTITSSIESGEHGLTFQFLYINGIKRSHRFVIQESGIVRALFDEESASYLQSEPKVFMQLFHHVHQSSEIAVEAFAEEFHMRSYHRDDGFGAKRHVSTILRIHVNEFDRYDFKYEEDEKQGLIICFKESRSLLAFCESVDIPMFTLFFSEGGQPVKVQCDNGFFAVSVIIASLEYKDRTAVAQHAAAGQAQKENNSRAQNENGVGPQVRDVSIRRMRDRESVKRPASGQPKRRRSGQIRLTAPEEEESMNEHGGRDADGGGGNGCEDEDEDEDGNHEVLGAAEDKGVEGDSRRHASTTRTVIYGSDQEEAEGENDGTGSDSDDGEYRAYSHKHQSTSKERPFVLTMSESADSPMMPKHPRAGLSASLKRRLIDSQSDPVGSPGY